MNDTVKEKPSWANELTHKSKCDKCRFTDLSFAGITRKSEV